MKWPQQNGVKIDLEDMTTDHIINAIKWLTNDTMFGRLYRDGISDVEWVFHLSNTLVWRIK